VKDSYGRSDVIKFLAQLRSEGMNKTQSILGYGP